MGNLFLNLDRNPANFQLNINSRYNYRSKYGATLTLIYIILTIIIFTYKIYGLAQRKNIKINTQVKIENDLQPLNLSSADFRLWLFHTDNNTDQVISFEKLAQYGLQVFFLEENYSKIDGEQNYSSLKHNPIKCQDGYKPLNYTICFPPSLNSFVSGRYDYSTPDNLQLAFRRIKLIVRQCQKLQNSSCENFTLDSFDFVLSFYNNFVNAAALFKEDIIKKEKFRRGAQSQNTLSQGYYVLQKIRFNRAKITTQNSIWPDYINSQVQQSANEWFYNEQITQYTLQDDASPQIFLLILFERSVYTHEYFRRFDRFDEILGQMSGIMGLMGGILFFIYQGYNGWAFEQVMKKQLGFDYEQPNLLRYYRYRLKKCFCRKKNRQQESSLNTLVTDSHQQNETFTQSLDYMTVIQAKNRDPHQSDFQYSTQNPRNDHSDRASLLVNDKNKKQGSQGVKNKERFEKSQSIRKENIKQERLDEQKMERSISIN